MKKVISFLLGAVIAVGACGGGYHLWRHYNPIPEPAPAENVAVEETDEYKALQSELDAANETVTALKADKTRLEGELTTKTTELAAANTAKASVEADVATLTRQKADISAEKSAVEARLTAIVLQKTEMETELEELAGQIAALEGNNAALQEEYDAGFALYEALQADYTALETQSAALQSDLDAANTALTGKQSELDAVNGQIETLDTQIETLNSELDDIKTALAGSIAVTGRREKIFLFNDKYDYTFEYDGTTYNGYRISLNSSYYDIWDYDKFEFRVTCPGCYAPGECIFTLDNPLRTGVDTIYSGSFKYSDNYYDDRLNNGVPPQTCNFIVCLPSDENSALIYYTDVDNFGFNQVNSGSLSTPYFTGIIDPVISFDDADTSETEEGTTNE